MLERFFKKQEKPPQIHKDFGTYKERWWFNREWLIGTPQIKLCFSFDDPSVLDDCPFVGKIAPNTADRHKYFGLVYSMRAGAEQLKQWAAQRNISSIRFLSYDSRIIEVISHH